MKKHNQSATSVTVNTFWNVLLQAWAADCLPESVFRVETQVKTKKASAEWKSAMLWIEPYGAIAALQIFQRKAGREVFLIQKDIRDQLKTGKVKFVSAKKRMARGGPVFSVWGFKVTKSHVLFEQLRQYLLKAAVKALPSEVN